MSNVVMLVLAIAAFAWGLSLATYRWVAIKSAWPMGTWQAERPLLPRLIGLASMTIALASGAVLGGGALLSVFLLGLLGAGFWIMLLKVGAQGALLLAPAAAALTLVGWLLGVA